MKTGRCRVRHLKVKPLASAASPNAGLNPAAPIEVVPHWGCRLEAPHMDEPMGIDLIPRQGVQFRHVSRVGTPRESCSGASTDPAAKRRFQQECASFAERIEREGMPAMAELY